MTSSTAYAPSTHPMRWGVVVALHILMGWALVSGTNISILKTLHKPMETVLIRDVVLQPPPAPQPKAKNPLPFVPLPDIADNQHASMSAITATVQAEPEVPVAKPVAVQAPPTPAFPDKVEAALICPGQVRPEIPRQAYLDNIQGLVQAQATVQDGQVREVRILSGPRIYHAAVKAAMQQYRCSTQSSPVVAMQSFNFRFE